jgi:hypothetical protein
MGRNVTPRRRPEADVVTEHKMSWAMVWRCGRVMVRVYRVSGEEQGFEANTTVMVQGKEVTR